MFDICIYIYICKIYIYICLFVYVHINNIYIYVYIWIEGTKCNQARKLPIVGEQQAANHIKKNNWYFLLWPQALNANPFQLVIASSQTCARVSGHNHSTSKMTPYGAICKHQPAFCGVSSQLVDSPTNWALLFHDRCHGSGDVPICWAQENCRL